MPTLPDAKLYIDGVIRNAAGGLCIAGNLPFGGYKASDIGREWGRANIEDCLGTKVIAWRVAWHPLGPDVLKRNCITEILAPYELRLKF